MFEFTILEAAAVKGTTVLAAASLIAWTLRKRSAAARHLVWTAAAAALLALPILALTLPALRVPAKSSGPMAFFQVFSNGRAGAFPVRSAATVAAPQHAAAISSSVNPRQWAAAAWTAGACFGLAQMLFACAALRR